MNIRVTEDAADDVENIKARITRDDGAHLGHDGIVDGTYERTVSRTPYVIVYRIDLGSKDELVILRVPRSSQERSSYHY